MATMHELFDGSDPELLPSDTPRVDALIAKVMAEHPGVSRTAQAEYYEEVHQHLAPLARELERETDKLRHLLSRLLEEESSSTSHADESSWETNTSCSLNSKSVRFALDEEQDKQTGA